MEDLQPKSCKHSPKLISLKSTLHCNFDYLFPAEFINYCETRKSPVRAQFFMTFRWDFFTKRR
jgi:hypothetical protein